MLNLSSSNPRAVIKFVIKIKFPTFGNARETPKRILRFTISECRYEGYENWKTIIYVKIHVSKIVFDIFYGRRREGFEETISHKKNDRFNVFQFLRRLLLSFSLSNVPLQAKTN